MATITYSLRNMVVLAPPITTIRNNEEAQKQQGKIAE
jgi:hypothetical protein